MLVLTVTTAAQTTRSTGTWISNAISGSYSHNEGNDQRNLALNVYAAARETPSGDSTAYVDFEIVACPSVELPGECDGIHAFGWVPAATVKVMGNSLSVNIADLRQAKELFGPDFYLSTLGSFNDSSSPIPVKFTIRVTNSYHSVNTVAQTDRQPQANGTVKVVKSTLTFTEDSSATQGIWGGYTLPVTPDPFSSFSDESGAVRQGTIRPRNP
jgi:hypothetical protein